MRDDIQGSSIITIVITLWVMEYCAIYMENIALRSKQHDHLDIIAMVSRVYRWRASCCCQSFVAHPGAGLVQSHRDWAS